MKDRQVIMLGPWLVCEETKFLMRASVVWVYRERACCNDFSSCDLFTYDIFSPLPPAWKYCLITSRAFSSTAHCFGVRLFGPSSFDMSCRKQLNS